MTAGQARICLVANFPAISPRPWDPGAELLPFQGGPAGDEFDCQTGLEMTNSRRSKNSPTNQSNPSPMNPQVSRRSFLKTTTGVILSSQFGCNILHAQNKGDKLRLAIIGTGGKGGEHLNCVKKGGDIVVAHCDIDSGRQGIVPATWPGSWDWRCRGSSSCSSSSGNPAAALEAHERPES